MLKNGVIMDVTNAAEARIAEEAGACAVMALERIPSEIRKNGGVARMSDPAMIKEIIDAVSIPVMAKCRIGHMVEAQILQAVGVDFIDESEVLSPADPSLHITKHSYKAPFVCGCKDLGEALRRISEGAAMIRTKGEAGTGNVIGASLLNDGAEACSRRPPRARGQQRDQAGIGHDGRGALRLREGAAGAVPPAQGVRPSTA